MALRFAAATLLAVAFQGSSAFACKGPSVIFQDNFQAATQAWHGNMTVANGQANVVARINTFGGAFYGAVFVDTGDACVDMTSPTVTQANTAAAGLMFGFTDVNNYYVFMTREDGQAAILRWQNGVPLAVVSYHPATALKTGAATNTLRVVWKGASGSAYSGTAYINDQKFFDFDFPPAFRNTMVGLYVGPEFESFLSPAITYQFGNLKVTNVPK